MTLTTTYSDTYTYTAEERKHVRHIKHDYRDDFDTARISFFMLNLITDLRLTESEFQSPVPLTERVLWGKEVL